MAGSMISRSADLRKLADKDDKDFQELKTRAFGNRDEKINLELDRYRRQKELMNQKQSDEDKLLNKFLAEIHYKNEIETRAKQEIEEMKFIIANLESSFATQKKIETKKELSQLLLEREMIYKFEQELYSSILEFKEFYDKWEYDRISGKKFTQGEINEKLQRMNLIKTKKEQVDYERKRIQDNFDRIKSGELKFLEKTKSNILLTELANPHRNFYNTNIYGIESMKIRMNEETNKLMDLRVIKSLLR